MRTIVIGASGQIGGWLARLAGDRGFDVTGTYATVPAAGLTRLDASDRIAAAHWLREQRGDVVLYPAGFTWVDGCEREPSRAHDANLEQPLNLARVVADQGGRFVYFSTDYVFDGVDGPYDEKAPTNPLSAYGRSKRDAELRLAEILGDRLLIVRTSWVFGPERQGKNFGYQLMTSLAAGREVVCPSDQRSSPSYGPDVAATVLDLVERSISGIVHVVGPEVVPRPEFAREIARAFGISDPPIVAKPTVDLGQGAPRPLSGGLIPARLAELGIDPPRSLADACRDFRDRLRLETEWATTAL
ncbi:MAG: SDR family oxidoreductase [Isosphaeraceae bacterium]|nr:SDR family oxidoreductase [Isosphaeraceae bacterium]